MTYTIYVTPKMFTDILNDSYGVEEITRTVIMSEDAESASLKLTELFIRLFENGNTIHLIDSETGELYAALSRKEE